MYYFKTMTDDIQKASPTLK